ncbi:MAG TPA: peptidoglycan-binding domain-containing protein, partial [Candidatus Paceibacterota bacterium]
MTCPEVSSSYALSAVQTFRTLLFIENLSEIKNVSRSTSGYNYPMKRGRSSSLCVAVSTILLTFVFCVGQVAFAQSYFFRTLKLGASGADVRELQKILNSDPDTVIAKSGPGSPSNESTYFGALTKGAVMRFQQKYKNDVLIPAGLTA